MRAQGLFTALWLVGCPGFGTGVDTGADVPERPTWADGVGPLLTVNCGTCHGESPIGGAPDGFRLDVYADTADDQGAFSMRDRIIARGVDQDPTAMPPGGSLTDTEMDVLVTWVDDGAPETADDLP